VRWCSSIHRASSASTGIARTLRSFVPLVLAFAFGPCTARATVSQPTPFTTR
jgi:hypothetical protein